LINEDLTKTEILRSANSLFQKWGFLKTTMEDIAREAGKSKCTLYHYYKNKEEVLEAVSRDYILRSIAKAKEKIAKVKGYQNKIKMYFYLSLSHMRQMSILNDVLRREIMSEKGLLRKLAKFHDEQEAEIIGSILREGREQGEFPGLDDEEVPVAVRAIMLVKRSLAMNIFIDNKDKESIDMIMKFLLGGFNLKTRPVKHQSRNYSEQFR
jgi:AcrR family transcriptional regulator